MKTLAPKYIGGGYKHLVEILNRQEKRAEIEVPLDAKLLISVGELSVRKNHKVVVEALQDLPDGYWYVIVGKGPLKEELEAMDTTGRLKLLGFRTDIRELLWSSDLFVFPSLQEGLPVALMEAMASGAKVIASNIRGNSDLTNSLTGENEAEAWQSAILKDREAYGLPEAFWKTNIDKQMRDLYQYIERE